MQTINKNNKISRIKFHKKVNQIMSKIENVLDQYSHSLDIDYEINHHIMNITFYNKSKIIINRQESMREIWLATNNMGYHFKYHQKLWICNKSGKDFWKILTEACSKQSNSIIIF